MSDTMLDMINNRSATQDSAELPIFAEGKYENIKIALSRGIFTRPTYFFATDLNRIGYIDSDLTMHLSESGSSDIIRTEALPSKEDARIDAIYIFNDVAYTFYDGMYKPLAKDYSTEIQNIKLDITDIKTRLEKIEQGSHKSVTEAANISQFPAIGEINHTYISLSENASYRWDPENLRYVCIGRDYTNIKQINGGSADPININ